MKRLDPRSNALKLFLAFLGVLIGGFILGGVVSTVLGDTLGSLFMTVTTLGAMALAIMSIFDARASLERHYNTFENIGLRLHPVLTFFFNVYYFQYHFSRINIWKKTGRLL